MQLYFHTDIPQYVRDAIARHLQSITFSSQYVVTRLDVVPERDVGYSRHPGDYWRVDMELEIHARVGVDVYPTQVTVAFRVPAKEPV